MKNVVIVDDNDTQLMLLELLLNQMGIKPVKFLDPIKAFEYIKSHKPDLLISDFNMPNVTGVELIREVKKLYPHLQTSIVSAMRDVDGSMQKECENLNAKLLLKPFDAAKFREFMKGMMQDDQQEIICIRKKDKPCILRDKVASAVCMSCCHDDLADEKEVIQNTIDAIDDFFPSSTMLQHVSTKLSFTANIMNSSNNSELQELLHIIKQLAAILHEYPEQILNNPDIMTLVSSYLNIIRDWFDDTFISETSSLQANNYTDSIRADFQSIEMALGISDIEDDYCDDLDDLFF